MEISTTYITEHHSKAFSRSQLPSQLTLPTLRTRRPATGHFRCVPGHFRIKVKAKLSVVYLQGIETDITVEDSPSTKIIKWRIDDGSPWASEFMLNSHNVCCLLHVHRLSLKCLYR